MGDNDLWYLARSGHSINGGAFNFSLYEWLDAKVSRYSCGKIKWTVSQSTISRASIGLTWYNAIFCNIDGDRVQTFRKTH